MLNNRHPADILAAGPDALAAAFGCPNRNPHPLVSDLQNEPLAKLAYACGIAARPQQPHEPNSKVMARGMSTSDFSSLLAAASSTITNVRFSAVAEHRAFCATIECRDFKPTDIFSSDTDGELDLVGEFGEIAQGRVLTSGGAEVRLRTFARVLHASRILIQNDQSQALAEAIKQLGTSGARTEAREVYAVLEGNPSLADGGPVFHADYSNVIAAALDATSLGQAMAALRTMTLPAGNMADLTAAHLVVAADLELPARKMVHESGLQLAVTATGRLPSGRWYALPDPETAPAIGVLQLKGSTSPILVEPWQEEFAFDGASMRARVDTGAVLVGRTLIRGGV